MQITAQDFGRTGRCPKCYGPVCIAAGIVSTIPGTPITPVAGEVPETVDWNVGDVILNLFEIKSLLGQGGMGKVYQVYHRAWQIDLAVKCPKPEALALAGGFETFERECETWVNLGLHPYTVSCYYVRRIGGIPRIFAEYVAGGSLWHWLQKGLLHSAGPQKALERALTIGIQTAWGLHHAHEMGLIHRDVKTPNVMMTSNGTAKVTDFGLAKALASKTEAQAMPSSDSPIISSIGGMTPAYCSPEQRRGDALTRATDIWSWGLCVLEMLVGRIFWRMGTEAPQALRHLLSEVATAARVPRVPPPLANLLGRCFNLDPGARPATMLEAADALREIYQESTGNRFPLETPKAVEGRAESLNNRAVSLMDLGKEEEAKRCWHQALQAIPHHPESTFNLELLRWRAGEITDEVLLQHLREVSILHPAEPLTVHLTAQAHLERGDWRAANSLLEENKNVDEYAQDTAALLQMVRDRYRGSRRLLRSCEGHVDSVNCVQFLPDGNRGISGSEDNTVRLWDLTQGRCMHVFEGHSGSVQAVALSPDGGLVLSAGKDRTLRLWDVETKECLRTFEGHSGAVTALAFARDGKLALSGGADNTLILWRLDVGHPLRIIKGHHDAVTSVQFSVNGQSAVSSSVDGTVRVWDLATSRVALLVRGHERGSRCARLTIDGQHVLSCGEDAAVRLWDTQTGECIRAFEGHHAGVGSVDITPDGRYVVSGGKDGTVRVWQTATGRCLRTFAEHTAEVKCVVVNRDGSLILSGSQDGTAKVWCLGIAMAGYAAPLVLCRALESEKAVTAESTFQRNLARALERLNREPVAAAHYVRRARALPGYQRKAEAMDLWFRLYLRLPKTRLENAWEGLTFSGHQGAVKSACISAKGRHFASVGDDHTLRLWETATGRCLVSLEGRGDALNSVSLAEDAQSALTAANDGTLVVWDFQGGAEKAVFESFGGAVESTCLSVDGRFIVTVGWEINLRDGATGRLLRSFEHDPPGAASVFLSRDSQLMVTGGSEGALDLWEVATGQCVRTFRGHHGTVCSVALSTDGRLVLSASGTPWGSVSELYLWDVDSGALIRAFADHESLVISAALSEDNRCAVSGHKDGSITLWDVATGAAIRSLQGHKDSVEDVRLARDGRFALSASADGALKTWVLDWELDNRARAPWDNDAQPYLNSFVLQHTPWAAELPRDRQPTAKEIARAFTRQPRAAWDPADVRELLRLLGCAGFGWLDPESVQEQAERTARRAGNISFVPRRIR